MHASQWHTMARFDPLDFSYSDIFRPARAREKERERGSWVIPFRSRCFNEILRLSLISGVNLLSEFVKRPGCTMHAIKSQRRQEAQKDHHGNYPLSPLSSLLSLSLSVSCRSPFSRMWRTRSRVFDVEASSEDARSQHMVPSCVPRLRSKNLPLAGRNVHVSRPSSSATFDILLGPAHPVPCSIQA